MSGPMAAPRSSSITAVVIAPWTEYKKAGPLLFSLDHQSKADDAPVHIFFSNVAVKGTGSENWIKGQGISAETELMAHRSRPPCRHPCKGARPPAASSAYPPGGRRPT